MLNRYWMAVRWGNYESATYWYTASEYDLLVDDYNAERNLSGVAIYDMDTKTFLLKWGVA